MARNTVTLMVDASGRICGRVPSRAARPVGKDAPTAAGVDPGPGCKLVDVVLDEKLRDLRFDELQRGYRVAQRGKVRLVRAPAPEQAAAPATGGGEAKPKAR